MERNWLIRTTQNQILGPVTKEKLIEFINKGALGLNDEVTSGNGYWFVLRERELVDRYVFGDIPQGYNPISESKSVLAKRENPEKTSSLNLSPANLVPQAVKKITESTVLPSDQDLEYPDLDNDITLVINKKVAGEVDNDITVLKKVDPIVLSVNNSEEISHSISDDVKLPASNDLEFPDMSLIKSMELDLSIKTEEETTSSSSEVKLERKKESIVLSDEGNIEANFPKNDDLEFPDPEEFLFSVNVPGEQEKEIQLSLSSDEIKDKGKKTVENITKDTKTDSVIIPKKDRVVKLNIEKEEKISLYERKPRRQDSDEEDRKYTKDQRIIPEELKKRNDNYLFFILIIISIILLGIFFYYREILNKPLPI